MLALWAAAENWSQISHIAATIAESLHNARIHSQAHSNHFLTPKFTHALTPTAHPLQSLAQYFSNYAKKTVSWEDRTETHLMLSLPASTQGFGVIFG